MPKRLVKTKKRTLTTIVIILGIYTVLNLFNKFINAWWVSQNGFEMTSYHPWTFYVSLVGGGLWLVASRLRKLGIWWYVPGILGVVYAVYMILGGALSGWFV